MVSNLTRGKIQTTTLVISDEAISGFLSIDLGAHPAQYALSFNNDSAMRLLIARQASCIKISQHHSAFIIQVNNNTSPNMMERISNYTRLHHH